MKKAILSVILLITLFFECFISGFAAFTPGTMVKSAMLMEASSGRIIYENNSHESLPPASVTKIMTMLLICEAIEDKTLTLDTVITASERAKSMGGSTIFLDTNEKMKLDDLLKGIAVASANDACVAVAEHMCGSVETFVEKMNKRAKELGMKDTNFVTCNGLDADNHHTSAYDIAIMSRELLKHEMITKYTTIWMDSLRDGKFQLANTNKLVRFYSGANGLKTGSTSKAGCCISASAKRDGMQLIAVVLGAQNSKDRFNAAREMLDYGFSNFAVTSFGEKGTQVAEIPVVNGKSKTIMALTKKSSSVLIEKTKKDLIKTHINIPEEISAPVKKGDIVGEMIVTLDGETLAKTNLIADKSVKKKTGADYFVKLFKELFV
ncbi:MAG: D-alanyl-D-alanine carboxypeptidase [Clostridia bacterium]|nr:D-alanyl-D-alanine carboxypeptidase [Clostridia bacterium]